TIYAEDEEELNAYVGWRHGLIEHLKTRHATATTKGIILFDGFDAARSDRKRNLFLRLIRRCITELRDNWTTMVSVRTFDAQKSRDLIRLFPSSQETERNRSRHISIPPLTDSEIRVALRNNDLLQALFGRSSDELKELLRNPFNLWLLEQ